MRRLTIFVLAVLLACVVSSGAATAAKHKERWQPYHEDALTLPAASYCGDFDLTSTPVEQRVRSRVLQRYESGAVRVQEFKGLLLVVVTNESTGDSVRRNLSGHAVVTFRADETIATYEMRGPIGFGWAQDDTYARGFYRMNGYHLFAIDPSGTKTVLVDHGTEENLCEAVA